MVPAGNLATLLGLGDAYLLVGLLNGDMYVLVIRGRFMTPGKVATKN